MTYRLQDKRILLVDDEALVALATEDVLISVGCHVVGPAHDLESALRMAEHPSIDAAVLDLHLAGVLVWPAAEALRARDIPFVFLTAFGRGLDLPPSCRQAPLLAKPLKADELTAALLSVLARSAASRRAFPARSPEATDQS